MKNLKKMLSEQRGNPLYFPVIGVDGYGGEQDGDTVILHSFQIPSLKRAKLVEVGDGLHIHWCEYDPVWGWTGAIGCWRSASSPELWDPIRKFLLP